VDCDQLNLAHVERTKSIKKTKTSKRHFPLSSLQVKIRDWRQSR